MQRGTGGQAAAPRARHGHTYRERRRRRGLRVSAILALLLGLGPFLTSTALARQASQPTTWAFTQVNIGDSQLRGNNGKNIVIAVVDGFVDATHPDFRSTPATTPQASRVLTGADCRSGNCVPTAAPPDGCGHGTHVAGTIAGATYGVATEAMILPVTVLAQDGSGTCSGSPEAVAAGIVWAANHGAQIINVSLGDGSGPALLQGPAVTAAVRAAAASGVLVVAAAGNNGNVTGTPDYDGNALVVAATGPNGQLASYSNRGVHVQLAAPGGDSGDGTCTSATCIPSTWLDHGFALLSGTSMAAPIVSGAAALMMAANPRLSRAGVMAALEGTATSLASAGSGLVNVDAAVRSVLGMAPGPTSATPSVSDPGPSQGVVPAGQAPTPPASSRASSSGNGPDGPNGPWQIALLLVIALGIASGSALLRRTD